MTDKKQQVAARIQRRMLREARQRLKEAQEALKISETQNKAQSEEHEKKRGLDKLAMDLKLDVACETIDKQKQVIAMLQQRVKNLGEEYHNEVFTRRVTTLDDVHKITREIEP